MNDAKATAKALRLLARQIQAPDDVPAMCLSDAADLIEKQAAELVALNWVTLTTYCPHCRKVFEVTSLGKPTNPQDHPGPSGPRVHPVVGPLSDTEQGP